MKFKRVLPLVLAALLMSCVGAFAMVEISPSLGARVANRTRMLFGPLAVAQVEEFVFQLQDAVKLWQHETGLVQAEAPWEGEASPAAPTRLPFEATAETSPARTPTPLSAANSAPTSTPAAVQELLPAVVGSHTPTPYIWQLPSLAPFGSLEGEGVWEPYIYDREGQIVAMRTFLQPDPMRPYTVVAVVAIDLRRARLHFKLGFNEPSLPDGPRGDGLIPDTDRQAGILLAAFNGGFRAANGQFGAMSDGIDALPPRDGLATVGIYPDGEIRIGDWGDDIDDSQDLEAWRQNARLIIQNGEISPRVYNDSITDWGASISNEIVTRRSGLGLDREAKTLYYFAGPSLSMPSLADAMLASGVHAGMLLDINHFWVHFTAIRAESGQLVAEPLLPADMIDQIDRYLGPSPADFFYVTLRDAESR